MSTSPTHVRRSTLETVLPGSAIERHEYYQAIANRILYGKAYTYLYIVLFLFQTALMIYGIFNYVALRRLTGHDVWYVICDVAVTLCLSGEVILRFIATKEKYCDSALNVIDLLVAIVCVGALFFYFFDPQAAVYGSALLAVRYFAQLVRLCCVLRNHRARQRIASAMENDVDFSNLISQEELDANRMFQAMQQDEEAAEFSDKAPGSL